METAPKRAIQWAVAAILPWPVLAAIKTTNIPPDWEREAIHRYIGHSEWDLSSRRVVPPLLICINLSLIYIPERQSENYPQNSTGPMDTEAAPPYSPTMQQHNMMIDMDATEDQQLIMQETPQHEPSVMMATRAVRISQQPTSSSSLALPSYLIWHTYSTKIHSF